MTVVTRYIYTSPITGKEYDSKQDIVKERTCLDVTKNYDPFKVSSEQYEEYLDCKSFLENGNQISISDTLTPISALVFICLMVLCMFVVIKLEEKENKYRA